MLESLERNIDKKFFNKTLKSLTRNRKAKTICYPNKTFLSIGEKDHINNIRTPNKDNLKKDFNSFRNLMFNKFDLMKCSFLRKKIP